MWQHLARRGKEHWRSPTVRTWTQLHWAVHTWTQLHWAFAASDGWVV